MELYSTISGKDISFWDWFSQNFQFQDAIQIDLKYRRVHFWNFKIFCSEKHSSITMLFTEKIFLSTWQIAQYFFIHINGVSSDVVFLLFTNTLATAIRIWFLFSVCCFQKIFRKIYKLVELFSKFVLSCDVIKRNLFENFIQNRKNHFQVLLNSKFSFQSLTHSHVWKLIKDPATFINRFSWFFTAKQTHQMKYKELCWKIKKNCVSFFLSNKKVIKFSLCCDNISRKLLEINLGQRVKSLQSEKK